MVAIELKGLRKSYGSVDVLQDIDLSIGDGEFLVLVGPSGCGKSTLLRCIAGLNTIDGGRVLFDGRPVEHLPPQERGLSMVFQNYALYPHLSVRENMAFGLKVHGVAPREIAERIEWAARTLNIEGLLDRRPRALSGGQRQRVAMGRAMVKRSGAFLFDEPLSNLDAKLRVQMRKDIRALQRDLSVTAVYVTHDQVEAMTMGDRIVVMRGGRIEQVGAPLELYDDPKNLFVAGFIGSPPMNFVSGEAAGPETRLADGTILRTNASANGPVTLGFRPEHCAAAGTGVNEIELRVRSAQHLGGTVSYFADLAGSEIEIQRPGSASTQERAVRVALDPDRILVFDGHGERVRP